MYKKNTSYDDYDEYNDTYSYDQFDSSYDSYTDEYYNNELVEYDEYNYDKNDNEEEYMDLKSKILLNRNKILVFIIIIMIIFLVIWLTPQFLNRSKNEETTTTVQERNINNDLNTIKKASLKYYNEENIPKEIGENKKITLEQLIKKNLIPKFNNYYDTKKSYISLTKEKNRFGLEIYLKSIKEKTRKKYYINNYTYCTDTYLCEEEEIKNIEEPQEEIKIENTATVETETINYLYEYSKTTNGKLSNWSLWSEYEKTNCSTKTITCSENDFNCLQEIKLYNRKEKIGVITKKYTSNRNSFSYQGTEQNKGCNSYDYIKINGNYYKAPISDQYTSIGTFTSSNPTNHGNWIYKGRKTFTQPPSDSLITRYVFVTSEKECNNCQPTPTYTYDIYNFQGNLKRVSNFNNECSTKSIQKTIPTYIITGQTITVNRAETLYGTVCYQSSRNRTILEKGSKKTTWSNYEDQSLLNNGYTYTGKTKEK